uniref:Uncharacterized protein n=1 Tax=Podarcis muralis TaxID=64176 RepID=A0A670J1W4_PODMU
MRNILAPIRRNHIIAELPWCFTKGADLFPLQISKIIVVGDLCGEEPLDQSVCRDTIDNNYKVTFGLWDTAGQECFKCIASTYYHGAQPIIIVFDLNDMASLGHTSIKQLLGTILKCLLTAHGELKNIVKKGGQAMFAPNMNQ